MNDGSASALIRLGLGLLTGNCWCCCRAVVSQPPQHSQTLSLSLSVHSPHSLFSPFPQFSVCILHLYSLPSPLTEVGMLPSAGASSRCSLFLSSHPHSLPLSPPSLAQPVCTLLRLCLRFSSPLSSSVSQWRQLREAAACLSASQLSQVKTAVSSDVANPKGGSGECSLLRLQVSDPGAGRTFLIISKNAS